MNHESVAVKFEQSFDVEEYISKTEMYIKKMIGDDFVILHNGGMSWTIQQKLKNVEITGSISL